MHTTLAILAAAGQIVAAWEGQGYEPQAPSPEQTKPLATVTALSDGHLPTCFTGHPTHPCPTSPPGVKRDMPGDLNEIARALSIKPISMSARQGEQHLPTTAPWFAKRDAPRMISKDYVPRANEWAIPGNFTFTDTVSKNSTGFASPTGSLTTSLTESTRAEGPTKAPQMGGDYMQKFNVSSLIDAITKDMYPSGMAAGGPPKATESPAAHKRDMDAHDMLDVMTRNTFPMTKVSAQSGLSSAMPTVSHQQHNATNTTSSSHLSGMIGTLLNGAMFPGQMRPASTSGSAASGAPTASSVQSAPPTTQAPSSVSATLIPISMSQAPNTTAPNESLQAFVHPINTEQVNEAQAITSSSTTSTSSASASASETPEPREPEVDAAPEMEGMDSDSDDDDFWKSSEPTLPPSRQWDEDKFDKELDAYLSSVIPADESSTQAHVAPTSSIPVQANSQPTMSSSVSSSASITEAATTSAPPQPSTFATSSRSVVRPPTTEQAVHWNRARAAKRFIS